ncbi:hypothetical protein LCGC14_1303230 [marine sediment metagenome]|uniref:HNH nuclease domain-containing protein n=1 Tax=marine sediment metagenome TaxID=412755 RepID=A0A0F9KQ74_9ZZZZ
MPRSRQPREIWNLTRLKVLERDDYHCLRCKKELAVNTAHIDHIVSGKLGSNHISNLRTLCRRCHVLRADHRHEGMRFKALEDGVIDENWRQDAWEEI